jgi:hypothetical protein
MTEEAIFWTLAYPVAMLLMVYIPFVIIIGRSDPRSITDEVFSALIAFIAILALNPSDITQLTILGVAGLATFIAYLIAKGYQRQQPQ